MISIPPINPNDLRAEDTEPSAAPRRALDVGPRSSFVESLVSGPPARPKVSAMKAASPPQLSGFAFRASGSRRQGHWVCIYATYGVRAGRAPIGSQTPGRSRQAEAYPEPHGLAESGFYSAGLLIAPESPWYCPRPQYSGMEATLSLRGDSPSVWRFYLATR